MPVSPRALSAPAVLLSSRMTWKHEAVDFLRFLCTSSAFATKSISSMLRLSSVAATAAAAGVPGQ